MEKMQLSSTGQKLINLYETMAKQGYDRTDGVFVQNAFDDFELRKFRTLVLPHFKKHKIKSVLDYGSGGSDWEKKDFDQESSQSAKDFFSMDNIAIYEPARGIDQRKKSECVVCMDVLEHVFVLDVLTVLRDIFSYAENLVVLNIACYKAGAKLPNDENAHITVRDPMWWKGMLDSISIDFPSVNILLLCSPTYGSVQIFESWNADEWASSTKFETEVPAPTLAGEIPVPNNEISVTKDQLFALIDNWLGKAPENRIELTDLIIQSLKNSEVEKP
jgi:hypothetical protein